MSCQRVLKGGQGRIAVQAVPSLGAAECAHLCTAQGKEQDVHKVDLCC